MASYLHNVAQGLLRLRSLACSSGQLGQAADDAADKGGGAGADADGGSCSGSGSEGAASGQQHAAPDESLLAGDCSLNTTIAGIPVDPAAGFRFTVDWFDPHAARWQKHILPLLLPGGIGSLPLNILEIGCWEGRSTCFLLLTLTVRCG